MTYSTTDADTLALGFLLPTGTDLIREGDNVISHNARTAAGLGLKVLNDVDQMQDRVDDMAVVTRTDVPGLVEYTLGKAATGPIAVLFDDFSTIGEIVGTTPDVGATPWAGALGVWSSDGSTATATAPGVAVTDPEVPNATVTAALRLVTIGSGSAQTLRLHTAGGPLAGSPLSLTSSVWVSITVSASGGSVTASLWKTLNGASTNLGALPTAGVAVSSAAVQAVDLQLTVDGLDVTARLTANGQVNELTRALTEPDRAALTGTLLGPHASTAAPDIRVDTITATRPRESTDDAMGNLVTATIDGHLTGPVLERLVEQFAPPSALERLRTLKAMGEGTVNIGVLSDSTANDLADWVRVWHQKWGTTLPSRVRRTYRTHASSAWGSEIVDNAGAAPDPGVIVTDTFTRTGEIVGSTPDTGPAWSGPAGYWSADGAKAASTGTGLGAITTNLASGDQLATLNLLVSTTPPSASQTFRVYLGAKGVGSGVFLILTLSTNGTLTAQLYKALPTSTALGSAVVVNGLAAGQTNVTLAIDMSTTVQAAAVTLVANGQTTRLEGQITEAEVFQRGNNLHIYGGASGSYFAAVDRVHLRTPAADTPPVVPTLAVHNAAAAGAGLTYWTPARRAIFDGLDLDVILISLGHNQQTQDGAAFVAGIAALVADMQARHPRAAVLISSQNPQVPPATGAAAHRARQAALRLWAKRARVDYVPAFEAFTAQPDGGASLISPDGIHPTTPPSGTTGAYGSVLWADTLTSTI